MLITYLRDDENNPRGCFVSDGRNRIGMSFCTKGDTFVKKVGIGLAVDYIASTEEAWDILAGMVDEYKGKHPAITGRDVVAFWRFKDRIDRYYKEE